MYLFQSLFFWPQIIQSLSNSPTKHASSSPTSSTIPSPPTATYPPQPAAHPAPPSATPNLTLAPPYCRTPAIAFPDFCYLASHRAQTQSTSPSSVHSMPDTPATAPTTSDSQTQTPAQLRRVRDTQIRRRQLVTRLHQLPRASRLEAKIRLCERLRRDPGTCVRAEDEHVIRLVL